MFSIAVSILSILFSIPSILARISWSVVRVSSPHTFNNIRNDLESVLFISCDTLKMPIRVQILIKLKAARFASH